MKGIVLKIIDLLPIGVKEKVSNMPIINKLSRYLFNLFLPRQSFVHVLKNGPAEGLKFRIELPEDKNILIGNYEHLFTQALTQQFFAGQIFYDIGGYKGYFSGVLAQMGAKEVHVFEPLPKNIIRIKDLQTLNPNLPIKLHEIAVSNFVGIAQFEIMADDSMGKLNTSSFQKGVKKSVFEVNTKSVDTLVFEDRLPHPHLVKIDVEGAEFSVLQGANKLIDAYNPIFLIEIHGYLVGKHCYDFLKSKNYSILVLETNQAPNFDSESEVCHYICTPIQRLIH